MGDPIFLSTSGSGIARASKDPAGSWSVETLLSGFDVRCFAADLTSREVLYAGTQGRGVLQSRDGGRTWMSSGLKGATVKALCASRIDPNTVYAGMKPPGLFVTHNGGADWQELEVFRRKRAFWWFSPADGSPFTPYVQSIALSPTDPNLILVGIELGAVLRSADGGKTWENHRPGALRDCHMLVAHPKNGDWLYEGGGTGAGVAFSRDGGKTWRQPKAGLDRHYGIPVAADPAQPEVWYAGLSPGPYAAYRDGKAQAYIFRSAGGAAWQKLGGGLPQPLDFMPYALLTDPSVPGRLYAGLSNGDVWQSTNYGDTWEKLPFNLGSIRHAMIMV